QARDFGGYRFSDNESNEITQENLESKKRWSDDRLQFFRSPLPNFVAVCPFPREDYRLSTLNCGGEDFAVACMRANLRYGKNQRREDVKSHHYIISFDPRDGPDNGLTVDRAQALGEKFCTEHFPGHQALVCTHPDGHNHSGNIHVHIVINSLRIEEVPFLPYMDRPADTKAG